MHNFAPKTATLPFQSGIEVQLEESFFVGDAAGRSKDHDDCDKMFAHNIGIAFHTDDGFFKEKKEK